MSRGGAMPMTRPTGWVYLHWAVTLRPAHGSLTSVWGAGDENRHGEESGSNLDPAWPWHRIPSSLILAGFSVAIWADSSSRGSVNQSSGSPVNQYVDQHG
jgi:hypothetical protein